MEALLGKSLDELTQIVQDLGLPKFTGKQLAQWLYVKRATHFDQMTNISLKGRQLLEQNYCVGRTEPIAEAISTDGTKKYLFAVGDNQFVETVYIPDDDRATICVSTQAGCKMGCKFCMTGTLGFHGHLTATDIVNQIFSIPDSLSLTNVVYMGEGEPLDNLTGVLKSIEILTADYGCGWSPHRITVSSVGILPELQQFIEQSECHLAISLHNPIGIERQEIMPIEKCYSIQSVIDTIKHYDFSHQRRVSFEYIMFAGLNDTQRHATKLKNLLSGLHCRVNLIRYHSSPDSPFKTCSQEKMESFRDYLSANGITTTIRRSRGEDIQAACGMLVNSLKN